jgi:oligopeptide/dipeptide ABC transporter ATP-binding protein
MANELLRVTDLRTEFRIEEGTVRAVDGVSFVLRERETLAIVGESGSGKSVMMLSLMGLLSASPGIVSGRIWYRAPGSQDALDLLEGLDHFLEIRPGPSLEIRKDHRGWQRWHERTMRERRGRDFAMIFQNPRNALHPHFTVGQQLAEAVRRRSPGLSQRAAADEARDWLARVHLDAPARRVRDYAHNLSGGMCQRVMVAMALAARPTVLIADEPTTGLDATIQSRVLDLMEEMKAELKTTTIVITHDMGVARRLADRVAVMYAGRIVETGPAGALLDRAHQPKHPYTQGLLASLPDEEDIRARARLSTIEGDVPDLSNLPGGCQFAERCALKPEGREHLCTSDEPPLERVVADHRVRCWRHLTHASEGAP